MTEVEIKINTEFIKLQQAIKAANIVSQGSDAKMLILDGKVRVNGKVIYERGKKIRPESIVEVENMGTVKVMSEISDAGGE